MPTKEHEIINIHSWRDSNGYCQDFEPTKENMETYFPGMNLEDYESPNIPGERMSKVTDDALKVKMKILIKDFTKKIKTPTSEQTKQLEIIEEKLVTVQKLLDIDSDNVGWIAIKTDLESQKATIDGNIQEVDKIHKGKTANELAEIVAKYKN